MKLHHLIAISALLFLSGCVTSGKTFTSDQLKLSGKKGIGLTLGIRDEAQRTQQEKDAIRQPQFQRMTDLQVDWNYSWNMHLVDQQPAEREFIPMVFSGPSTQGADAPKLLADQLAKSVTPQIRAGRIKRMLCFNEPDQAKQGNLTVAQALALWPTLEALGVPLCSPACANTEGTDAKDAANQGIGGNWMPTFMREVDRLHLRVDYIGTHAYPGPNAEAFKSKLHRIYDKYGHRPLLITEFAIADWKTGGDITKNRYTKTQVLQFAKEVLPWMERQDWIVGYAWFPFGINSPHGTCSALFDTDGHLTALGRYYRSVTPTNPDGDQTIQPD